MKIELEGMKFRANHGCLERERAEGNDFEVDFSCVFDGRRAAESDNLADTVDYGRIYDLIAVEMAQPSDLLENVAWRIAESVNAHFPGLESFSVRVSKANPPVNGECRWSRVTVNSEDLNDYGQ